LQGFITEEEMFRAEYTFAKDNLDGSADIGAVAIMKYGINQS
jgi:hypothetical protein